MSDCKGCKYWTQALEDYINGTPTDKKPNPFCSTCEGDKYQPKGAKITIASFRIENEVQAKEIAELKDKIEKIKSEMLEMYRMIYNAEDLQLLRIEVASEMKACIACAYNLSPVCKKAFNGEVRNIYEDTCSNFKALQGGE